MAKNKAFKYKNQSEQPQVLVGYGKVEVGKTIESNEPIHNPNFVLVGSNRRMTPAETPKQGKNNK
jgi:hypothetical protein